MNPASSENSGTNAEPEALDQLMVFAIAAGDEFKSLVEELRVRMEILTDEIFDYAKRARRVESVRRRELGTARGASTEARTPASGRRSRAGRK